MTGTLPWWKTGAVYQIYPRSFQDSDGDGVGDLPGILSRIDAIADLGVDAIWLSPVHPSPQADFGYDIADYTGVDPLFGSLDDLDALIDSAAGADVKTAKNASPSVLTSMPSCSASAARTIRPWTSRSGS